ncbi:MAG: hypothetical protein QXH20_05850 [Candidatus Bathyarchaeia archaeon]
MGFIENIRNGRVGVDFGIPYGPGLWRALASWPSKFLNKVNTIVQFSEFSCSQNYFYLYVTMALPAAGEFVLALLDFDWDDIVRAYIRPKGLRIRNLIPSLILDKYLDVPELGEAIGVRIPGAKIVKGITDKSGLRVLFIFDAILQKLFYYWMIIDLTADFFYYWSAGIFRSRICPESSDSAAWYYLWDYWPREKASRWIRFDPVTWAAYDKVEKGDPIYLPGRGWGHQQKSVQFVWFMRWAWGLMLEPARHHVAIGIQDVATQEIIEIAGPVSGVEHAAIVYRTKPGQYIYPVYYVGNPDYWGWLRPYPGWVIGAFT